MKYWFICISILLLATSCQFFETEKVSSEEVFKEEMGTINWKDVDNYPSFPNCENAMEKLQQLECFINTISAQLYKSISHENMVAARDIYDTVKVKFEVSSKGVLSIQEIKIDTLLQNEFPHLETWLLQSIDSLQPLAPAYKRGIPVKTQFTLPVIIKTN